MIGSVGIEFDELPPAVTPGFQERLWYPTSQLPKISRRHEDVEKFCDISDICWLLCIHVVLCGLSVVHPRLELEK